MSLQANGSGDPLRKDPQDVGIIGLHFYFPKEYVEQAELAAFDKVPADKYLKGLGQTRMGISSDLEDINSICLTVVMGLLEKYNVSPVEVGYMSVGSETLVDKSKSIKTVLMQLFEQHGNMDVQGVDNINACFGGTAALHASVDWITGQEWDGRYAVVVCGDIAVYAKGAARPTGGAGAIALLIGPNAPLVIDRGVRTHYVKHAYDFYKPDFSSEYPLVDGQLSVNCYMEAVFNAYASFRKKFARINHRNEQEVSLQDFDGLVFHAPYCKIVSKALSRLVFSDLLNDPDPDFSHKYKGLEKYR